MLVAVSVSFCYLAWQVTLAHLPLPDHFPAETASFRIPNHYPIHEDVVNRHKRPAETDHWDPFYKIASEKRKPFSSQIKHYSYASDMRPLLFAETANPGDRSPPPHVGKMQKTVHRGYDGTSSRFSDEQTHLSSEGSTDDHQMLAPAGGFQGSQNHRVTGPRFNTAPTLDQSSSTMGHHPNREPILLELFPSQLTPTDPVRTEEYLDPQHDLQHKDPDQSDKGIHGNDDVNLDNLQVFGILNLGSFPRTLKPEKFRIINGIKFDQDERELLNEFEKQSSIMMNSHKKTPPRKKEVENLPFDLMELQHNEGDNVPVLFLRIQRPNTKEIFEEELPHKMGERIVDVKQKEQVSNFWRVGP
ncbi:hypothetical protein H4Q26_012333 [Puccinia striiformis f. sp. tritici PST-130]|uniref:Uncharacterized protein n=1 Tax=Puccinia striiformis f. sp. tritici PST-78 TaxID=1165861 RepID=A0A0L0V162_9BASI|nr:hypothetical protein H4Q26_012333 [Puccinia striiformis f. sp. tritici PST-130]KNE92764.1 hypothetical protein PSTG_13822 [Puccinia striiformis f. sp. tritici PST-78]